MQCAPRVRGAPRYPAHHGLAFMTVRSTLPILALALAAALTPARSSSQVGMDIPGVVVDVSTGRGIPDVLLRLEGTDVSAATDEAGRFVLRGVPPGRWILQVDHLAYGRHRHEIAAELGLRVDLQVRLAPEAIEIEPLVVEVTSLRQQMARAKGSSLNVVERDQIERALGTSKHLGDLIRQTIPGIRVRQTNNLAGTNVCLEFRGAATISLLETRPCSHPMVLLDGVTVSDPNYLYGTVGLSNIERIEVIPPGEAGARYGTGSLYGVILIETRPPGTRRFPDDSSTGYGGPRRGRAAFDWSQDLAGYPLPRAVAGAFLGNALGLTAGAALGKHCVMVDDKDQIVTSCGGIGTAAAILGALALPALGGAVGVRFGGGTKASVGRFLPALLGAGMMVFPGYAFSMSTVGGGSEAANAVGYTLLVVGTPLVLTMADRLFRSMR